MLQKQMKKLKNVFGLSVILFLSLFFASPLLAEDICLPTDTVSKMTVDLEKCQLLKERYNLLEQGNSELEKQIELLEKINALQKEQLQVLEDANKQYKDLLETQEKMCKEAIKASKPGFFSEMFKITGSMGIGALLAMLLML